MRKSIAAGFAVAALAGVMVAAPASAASNDGLTVLTFNKKTWNAINAEMMVKPGGKTMVINVRSFGFPSKALDQDTIVGKGSLSLVRADASWKMRKPVLDLANASMAATVAGMGPDYELFDLAGLKQGKRTVKAKVNLAMGQAAMLNQALKTDIFKDGMAIGKVVYE